MQDVIAATVFGVRRCRASGFTILELAVTLAILSVLAAGILVPFVAQVAQRNAAATDRILEQAREALLGYATAHGRLPCPATDASNGNESPTPPAASGACTSYYGFFPAATIGFAPIDSQGFAIDGWGTTQNRIRYAVSDFRDVGGNLVFTRAGGIKSVGPSGLGGVNFIYVCASGASSTNPALHCGPGAPGSGGSTVLTSTAPAVIWSLGANAATGGTGADEAQNQFPGPLTGGAIDRIFVSKTMSNMPGSEFDDIVTWFSVGNLVSRMVIAGQLP